MTHLILAHSTRPHIGDKASSPIESSSRSQDIVRFHPYTRGKLRLLQTIRNLSPLMKLDAADLLGEGDLNEASPQLFAVISASHLIPR